IEEATVATERRERASAGGAPRRSRRWLIPGAAAAALVLVTGLVIALKPSPTYVPSAGTVARIQADRFERPVPVGSFPIEVAEGGGRIWVLDRQSQVYWVEEESGRTGSRGTDGIPTGAAFGSGDLWITAGFGGGAGADATVSRFDPATGQLTAAFH